MYVDKQTEFSDSQAVTSTAISTNVYDLFSVKAGGAAASDISPNTRIDIGSGTGDLYLIVNTAVLATAGGAATLTVSLESADDAGLTTNAIVHYSTTAVPIATFGPAGTSIIAVRLPPGLYRRYLGIRYTVATGPLTAGQFDAFLTPDLQMNRIYKAGFTVQ